MLQGRTVHTQGHEKGTEAKRHVTATESQCPQTRGEYMPSYNIVYDISNNNSLPTVVANKLNCWFRCRNMLHNHTNEGLWRSCNIFPIINPMKYGKFQQHTARPPVTCSLALFKVVHGRGNCANKEHRLVQSRFH